MGWSYHLSVELISGSAEHPLLSGFYRMLETCMGLCQRAGMFQKPDVKQEHEGGAAHHQQQLVRVKEQQQEESEEGGGAQFETAGVDEALRHVCTLTYREFLEDVLVACRRFKVSKAARS